jgi:hypothetical protein
VKRRHSTAFALACVLSSSATGCAGRSPELGHTVRDVMLWAVKTACNAVPDAPVPTPTEAP